MNNKKLSIVLAMLSGFLTSLSVFAAENNPAKELISGVQQSGLDVIFQGSEKIITEIEKPIGGSVSKFVDTWNGLIKTENTLMMNLSKVKNPYLVTKYTNQLKVVSGQKIVMKQGLDDFLKLGVKIDTNYGLLKSSAQIGGGILNVVGVGMTAKDAVAAYKNGDMERYNNKLTEVTVSGLTIIGFITAGASAPFTVPAGLAVAVGGALNTATENNTKNFIATEMAQFDLDAKLLELKISEFKKLAEIPSTLRLDVVRERINISLDSFLRKYLLEIDIEISKLSPREFGNNNLFVTDAQKDIYTYLLEQRDFIDKIKNNNNDVAGYKNQYVSSISDAYYKHGYEYNQQQEYIKKVREDLIKAGVIESFDYISKANSSIARNSAIAIVQSGTSPIGSASFGYQLPLKNVSSTSQSSSLYGANYKETTGYSAVPPSTSAAQNFAEFTESVGSGQTGHIRVNTPGSDVVHPVQEVVVQQGPPSATIHGNGVGPNDVPGTAPPVNFNQ